MDTRLATSQNAKSPAPPGQTRSTRAYLLSNSGDVASRFLRQVVLRPGVQRRLVPTRANCQPALAVYLNEPHTDVAHANGLLVLTLADAQISGITRFDAGVFSRFGLPRTVAKLT